MNLNLSYETGQAASCSSAANDDPMCGFSGEVTLSGEEGGSPVASESE